MVPETTEELEAGWYKYGDSTLRYWDGERWTENYAPRDGGRSNDYDSTSYIIWAMSLMCGLAGVLAWDAPVFAYFWPLGLGGAGLALAVIAFLK